jgi:chromate reductase, NAD(P)H dehydrogenase (quinone)
MQSLLFSLQALKAKIVTQLPLYKTDFKTNLEKIEIPDEEWQMIKEAVLLLG